MVAPPPTCAIDSVLVEDEAQLVDYGIVTPHGGVHKWRCGKALQHVVQGTWQPLVEQSPSALHALQAYMTHGVSVATGDGFNQGRV